MKVTSIETIRVDMPMKRLSVGVHGTRTHQECILVRMRTDEGIEGLGDVEPSPIFDAGGRDEVADVLAGRLAPALIGHDPRRAREAHRKMAEAADGYYSAKAALDMALMDIHGKALGVPVHELLGGAVREEILFNAWIGVLPAEEAAAEALGFCDRGWTSCKVKLGGNLESDAARVLAIREAVGDRMAIRLDANESYGDVDAAIALGREVRDADPVHFEQPVPRENVEGLARVRRAIGFPVMADECIYGPDSLLRIIRAEAADTVKLKVLKQGSLLAAREMASTAEAAGLRLVIGHGFGLTGYTLAEIHVAATCAAFLPAIESVGPEKMTGDVVDRPLDLGPGRIPLPTEPGLGVSFDEEKLEGHRAKNRASV